MAEQAPNKWLITLAVMVPTLIEILDTSIANVALGHIQGSLSAGQDEVTWVLTSYLVSNAIVIPIEREEESIEPQAVDAIIAATQGYPYFLQEWGKHAWDVAQDSPITLRDVEEASRAAIAALDESFFRVRFDRLTPLEKRYLRAMAELGPGPHRSGDIADQLKREVTSLGPTRGQLIAKGMIWSPSHGDTAFTVPLFDDFMRRIMPGDDWKE